MTMKMYWIRIIIQSLSRHYMYFFVMLQFCSCHCALYYGRSAKDKEEYGKHWKEWKSEIQDDFTIIKIEYYRTFYLIIAERNGLWYKIFSKHQGVCSNEFEKLSKGMRVRLHLIKIYPSNYANITHFNYFFKTNDGISNEEIYCDYKTGQKIYESPDIKSCYVNINNVISQK